jgi:hypothetical protein
MKNTLILLAGVLILMTAACSKKSENTTPATPLVFNSLDVSDTTMKVNGLITCSASASGDGLTYHWSATYGSFVGSGATVNWTVCHSSSFVITCEVKDVAGNSATKQRTIKVHV